MTKQITLKLNENKFKPLIEELNQLGGGNSTSFSEIAGKAIFFSHLYFTEKLEKIGNKTRFEQMLEHLEKDPHQGMLDFLKKYKEFTSNS